MSDKLQVWGERFKKLKGEGKFTKKQMNIIFRLLDDISAFRSYTISESARRQLDAVFKGA